MKKKTLLWSLSLVLASLFCGGPAIAADAAAPVPSVQPAPVPAVAPVCQPALQPAPAPVPAVADETQAIAPLGLFLPEPLQAAPPLCPDIGCFDGYCSRDSNCTAAPGGTCHLFCPKKGCCVYPG